MRVYVAGPYTKGDVAQNVRNAITAGNALAEAGHSPFIPHLSHFWHLLCPHEYRFWTEQDRVWLLVVDAVVRLAGESAGADEEVNLAISLSIPIFDSVDAFLARYPDGR